MLSFFSLVFCFKHCELCVVYGHALKCRVLGSCIALLHFTLSNAMSCAVTSTFPTHHITSHHITSHHITSHHITSHHITSHHITSHHTSSHHTTPHHITPYLTLSNMNVRTVERAVHRGSTMGGSASGIGSAFPYNWTKTDFRNTDSRSAAKPLRSESAPQQ